jgi:hypothetical protein
VETRFATYASPGGTNEDAVVAGEGFAVVLDGATPEPGTDSGCVHSVRWFVTELVGNLARLLTCDGLGRSPLTETLRHAIETVGRSHRDTCDLTNPRSPAATVAIVREHPDHVEYLVLGDTTVAVEDGQGRISAVTDDRIERFADRPWAELCHVRNMPGGFWVAGGKPAAAGHAMVGRAAVADVRRIALFTDGATRLVERYGWEWRALLDVLDTHGPAECISRTRAAESGTPVGRFGGKHHDDATAVLCRFPTPAPA